MRPVGLAQILDLDGDVGRHRPHHGNLPPSSMRCACIDIGSNTTRLLVADVVDGRLLALVERRAFTRIGRKIDVAGEIPDAAIAEVAAVVAAHCAEAADVGRAARARRGHRRDPRRRQPRRADRGAERPGRRRGRRALGRRRGAARVPGSDEHARGGPARGRSPWSTSAACRPRSRSARSRAASRGRTRSRSARARWPSAATATRRPPTTWRRCAPPHAPRFGDAPIPHADDAVAVGGSAASLPTLVGPVLDAAALERALGVLCGAPAAEVARRNGLAPERMQLLPAGILVLDAAAQRLGPAAQDRPRRAA